MFFIGSAARSARGRRHLVPLFPFGESCGVLTLHERQRRGTALGIGSAGSGGAAGEANSESGNANGGPGGNGGTDGNGGSAAGVGNGGNGGAGGAGAPGGLEDPVARRIAGPRSRLPTTMSVFRQ